jgi:hypothetical protein
MERTIMKRLTLLCLAALALLVPSIATAEICTIDNVPAATLLLPYFEVDLADPQGVTTLFSINNASASAAVAHVVMWSDLSVPTLDFDVYLTGFDNQAINLRDIFNGILPVTADDGEDPTDTISPQGPISQDINFPGASGACGDPIRNPVSDIYRVHLATAHTGQLSPLLGACAGQDLGDTIARGYITVDTVTQCSLLFPGDAGYFSSGIADNRNIFWGDWQIANPTSDVAIGDSMVAIESAQGGSFFPGSFYTPFVPGDYTFYGRYVAGTAIDQREPLPTVHMVRYINSGAANTDFLVWRDAKTNQGPFTCGTTPAWYPLAADQVVLFDEEENPGIAAICNISPCTPGAGVPLPAETQRVPVSAFENAFDSGFAYLDLSTTTPSGLFNGFAQSWVVGVHNFENMSTAQPAVALDSACQPSIITLPIQ